MDFDLNWNFKILDLHTSDDDKLSLGQSLVVTGRLLARIEVKRGISQQIFSVAWLILILRLYVEGSTSAGQYQGRQCAAPAGRLGHH